MSIKNNIKYQDGGDPIKGKKPKKRIILAETPTAIDKSYNLVPIDSKKYPLGTFSADIMREGRNKLLDEIVSLEKRLGIEQEGRDDGSDLLDDIFGATNSSMSISEITKIVKDNYGVDISKEDGIIDAYKRATGYPGVIKYGFDKYNLKETITETKDDTFLQEAKKAARLSKENGVPAEVVPIYGKEQFEQFKARYNKEALNGADIVILGHSSDKKMFGVPNKELNDFLRDNMDSSNICYGGTCTGPKVAASMPDVPNMYVNMGEPWIGVPDYKSYAGRDFNETFFGNAEVFNGQDEWATAKPIRAKYGVDYTNYRKDPVTILSETPEVVNIPRPQQNIQPLPTIQSGVSRMQNGGGTNRKSSYNSDIENKLNKLYLSEKYKKASKLDKAGMIAEIDPLSLLQKGLGAGIAMTGIPALLRNLTVEKAVVGAGLAGASGVTGLLAGQLASDPIKNKINRAVGANIYPTKTASDRNIITRDTTIDLSNNNLSFARVGEKVPANILLGGEFTENSNDSVRKAKDWLNSVKSTYSDKKLKVSDVKDFYGVENGSFKVGKPEDFNEETLIVPNRFGNEKIANASVVNDGLRLTSNSGDIIYNNIPVGGKLILYSPSTKKSSFISFETPNKGADEINKFVKENKDAQPIILDNGRYRSYINNPKGISDANYDNYYNLDKKRKNTPGYNILINSSGTDKETTVKKKQDGGAANYLEQILGAVNQGNPFTPKNEKASLLGYDTWLKDNGYTSFWDKANKQKEYANYVASNKSFNEQLPLGPNFGGLFELNQMATDEQLNKKDTLADYTKSISTYAPQGFAQQGGGVSKVEPTTLEQLIDMLDVPQKLMMEKIIGEYKKPSELMTGKELGSKLIGKDNYGLVADLILDPLNIVPLSKVKYLKVKGLEGLQKVPLSVLQKIGNIIWGADKVNDAEGVKDNILNKYENVIKTENGGEIFTENTKNQMPSLQAILAGLPKEMKAKDKQKVAANAELELQQILGYKDNSPYKDLPSQDFNTDTLTMDGVSQNLLAIANNGQTKLMGPNSGTHYFPGATQITEVPMAQQGGQPTRQDSLDLYNNAIEVEKYYKDRNYKKNNYYQPSISNYINSLESDRNELERDIINRSFPQTSRNGRNRYGDENLTINDYYQKIDENRFKQRESASKILDLRAPMQLYDKRIKPQSGESYNNDVFTDLMFGDQVDFYKYDPIMIKPTDMLTPEETVYRRNKILDIATAPNLTPSPKTMPPSVTTPAAKETKKVSPPDISGRFEVPKEKEQEWRYKYLPEYDGKKLGTFLHNEEVTIDGKPYTFHRGKLKFVGYDNSELGIDQVAKKEIKKNTKKLVDGGQPMLDYMQGGGPRQMIFNLFKQRPMSKYADGGFSHRAPSYQFNLPVGNKTKVSGFLPLESLIPIQTEKKELIVLPDGSVVPVNAKQRHSQMTDDQVTDIVPENSYILSQFGQVDIYRSEADEVIIETENKPYNLYGVNPEPRVKTLGDIMNKKVMKPADLGRALTTKYKQIDNAGDPYTEQTNMANKETLSKYLQALIGLSEMDKARKGIDNSMEAQMSQGQLPQMVAVNGGTVMRSSNVPKAQVGLFAAAGASLLTGAFNYFSNRSAQKKADRNRAASLAEIAKWRNQQLGLSNTGLGIGMASVFAQDPTVDPVLQQSGYLDSMQKGLPQQFLDYQQSRNLANRPDFSGLGAQESNALNTQYYSQTLNSQSALALQAARDRAAMFNQYLQAKGQIQNFNIASRTNATNATRVNANNMISTAGGIGMGNITDRQNIETNALQSKLAANNNALQFSLNRMGAENQGYLNSLALGTQVYNSITANQPAVNQNNVQPRSTDQYQDPYGFNGTQGYGMSNYTSNPYDFTANAAPTGAGPLYSQNNPSDCILGRNIRTGLPC